MYLTSTSMANLVSSELHLLPPNTSQMFFLSKFQIYYFITEIITERVVFLNYQTNHFICSGIKTYPRFLSLWE